MYKMKNTEQKAEYTPAYASLEMWLKQEIIAANYRVTWLKEQYRFKPIPAGLTHGQLYLFLASRPSQEMINLYQEEQMVAEEILAFLREQLSKRTRNRSGIEINQEFHEALGLR